MENKICKVCKKRKVENSKPVFIFRYNDIGLKFFLKDHCKSCGAKVIISHLNSKKGKKTFDYMDSLRGKIRKGDPACLKKPSIPSRSSTIFKPNFY